RAAGAACGRTSRLRRRCEWPCVPRWKRGDARGLARRQSWLRASGDRQAGALVLAVAKGYEGSPGEPAPPDETVRTVGLARFAFVCGGKFPNLPGRIGKLGNLPPQQMLYEASSSSRCVCTDSARA